MTLFEIGVPVALFAIVGAGFAFLRWEERKLLARSERPQHPAE
ncbi:hypothetical protein [Qingshengfaniella alkalisoli]|nr:hypothetical protein [Qingshengfaniella alkalisoli]